MVATAVAARLPSAPFEVLDIAPSDPVDAGGAPCEPRLGLAISATFADAY